MAQLDKLAERFRTCTGAFPYRELIRLLTGLGYVEVTKNGGSSRRFYNQKVDHYILAHEPHPGNEIKNYLVRQIREQLSDRGLL